MFPTQIYKPKDFDAEVKKIKERTTPVWQNGEPVAQDKEGNIFRIDFQDGTIQIN